MEVIAVSILGVMFIVTLIVLAIYIPNPTAFQWFIFRVVLALSAGAVGAIIPGFLSINITLLQGIGISAGGAMAFFLLIYKFNPPPLNDVPAITPIKRVPPLRRVKPPQNNKIDHSRNKKPAIALILSLIPGIGQMYNRQVMKGVVIFLIHPIILYAICDHYLPNLTGVLKPINKEYFSIIEVIFYIVVMRDAYYYSKKLRNSHQKNNSDTTDKNNYTNYSCY